MNDILFFFGLMAWPFQRSNEADMTMKEMFLIRLALVVDVVIVAAFVLSGLAERLINDILILLGYA